MGELGDYVLMTPARNEADYFELTALSVTNQQHPPRRWVIIDDGSTDATAEIAADFAARYDYIELHRAPARSGRSFAAKARALGRAYELLLDGPHFDYIGNLDADVSFGPAYYRSIIGRLDRDPSLGLAGGIQFDRVGDGWELLRQSANSVPGPFQLFRRRCFDEIGRYRALPHGGIDAAAEFAARQRGWRVEAFPDAQVFHHRTTGTAEHGRLAARFKAGRRDLTLGYHPAFAGLRALQMAIGAGLFGPVGAGAFLAGYVAAAVQRTEPRLDPEIREFVRAEQLARIRALVATRRDPVKRIVRFDGPIPSAPYGP